LPSGSGSPEGGPERVVGSWSEDEIGGGQVHHPVERDYEVGNAVAVHLHLDKGVAVLDRGAQDRGAAPEQDELERLVARNRRVGVDRPQVDAFRFDLEVGDPVEPACQVPTVGGGGAVGLE